MKPAARFLRVTLDGPPRVRAWRIVCSRCPAMADLPDDRHGRSEAERDRRFAGLGWRISRKGHACPACAEPPALAAELNKPKGEAMTLHADPPPEPTRDDNRIIHDAIDAAWDAERGLYRGACSDDEVARAVDRPRDWVRRIREAFFGPTDACVSRADGLAALAGLEDRAREIVDRAMTLAADAEALQRDVARARKATGV
jgi:hypothetical protein